MNKPEKLCPICARHAPHAPFTPFCSRRCADVDLGRWLTGHYVAPGEPLPGESLEEQPATKDDRLDPH